MTDPTPNADDSQVDDLLVEWELARLNGSELSAETLARDHPELLTSLRDRIAVMRATAWVLDDPLEESPPSDEQEASPDNASGYLPQSHLTDEDFLESLSATLAGISGAHETLVDQATKELASGATSQQLASRLVDEGVLSAYQAKVLLTRGAGPLLLDRYVLLDLIGVGGMGRVYKALHRSMERVVALKVLPANVVNSPGIAERFRREIKAAARLNHANIVAAFDAHQSGDRHFLVMEYVTGKNLFDLVNDHGPLPEKQAVEIISQTAAALGEAHMLGIVHRDVKPSNILLSEDGVPKLLDLGIASFKESLGADQNEVQLTQDGVPIGTVAYLSPEQARDSRKVDGRADIYSLGCTLNYLLTGRPLFDKRSAVEMVAAHLTEEAPRLTDSTADVSSGLQAVFERMVAKTPDARYGSTQELTQALASLRSPEQASRIVGDSGARYLSPAQRSNRWLAIAGFVALVVIATAFFRNSVPTNRSISPLVGSPDPGPYSNSPHLHATQHVREVAAALLRNGAQIYCTTRSGTVRMRVPDEVPIGHFEIGIVDLTEADSLEASIGMLRELPELSELWITGRSLSNSMVEEISSVRALQTVELSDTDVDDAGIEHFIGMPNLIELNLGGTKVTPAAIRRFRGLHSGVAISAAEK